MKNILDVSTILLSRIFRFLLILALSPVIASANPITGPVTHIRDGDTFVIGHQPIRLCGINTPEIGDHVIHKHRSAECAEIDTIGRFVANDADRCMIHEYNPGADWSKPSRKPASFAYTGS